MTNKPWFAVVNPSSANGKTGVRWPFFMEKLCTEGLNITYSLTTQPNDATEIVRRALKDGYDRIISVGGDGTLNEVVNGLFENEQLINEDVELAILSHGTGGDFCRTLGFSKGVDDFLSRIKQSNVQTLDLGLVCYYNHENQRSSRYFINVSDVGLGAQTAALVNQTSKFFGGRLSFLWGSLKTIVSYHNKPMRCFIDNEIIVEGRTNSIVVANGRYFGGGMMIAPQAATNDGLLDIVVLGDFSTAELLYHLPKIYTGSHTKVKGVSYYQGKRIRIESTEPLPLEVDGEHLGYAPVEFSLMPQTIKIWC